MFRIALNLLNSNPHNNRESSFRSLFHIEFCLAFTSSNSRFTPLQDFNLLVLLNFAKLNRVFQAKSPKLFHSHHRSRSANVKETIHSQTHHVLIEEMLRSQCNDSSTSVTKLTIMST